VAEQETPKAAAEEIVNNAIGLAREYADNSTAVVAFLQ
jgi:hypothetical protein